MALALVAIFYVLSSPTLPTGSDPAPALSEPNASPSPPPERPALPDEPRAEPASAEPDDPLTDDAPPTAATVHASLAAYLNRVAVICPLPDSIDDGIPFGAELLWIDAQRTVSAVVDELEGSKVISINDPDDPDSLVASFHLRWAAKAWGEQVPCHIEPVEFGTVELTIKTEEGEPLHGNFATSCAERGQLERGRLILTRAVAMTECHLIVLPSKERPDCAVSRVIPGPEPGETLEMSLTAPCDGSEHSILQPVNAPPKERPPKAPKRSDQLVEAERLRDELPDDSDGAKLLDRWIQELRVSLEIEEIYSILDEPEISPEDQEAVLDEIVDVTLKAGEN